MPTKSGLKTRNVNDEMQTKLHKNKETSELADCMQQNEKWKEEQRREGEGEGRAHAVLLLNPSVHVFFAC